MGKTYIDTLKYMVHADVSVEGIVEKPDIVGAVFGQTEGLLGDDLDLRELQKNGRIGRIEVDLSTKNGKTYGKVKMPSSLDMVETSILAAALESVDRIGPCEGHVTVERIEDTRDAKRKHIIDRAKKLLKTMLNDVIPDSRELSEVVRSEVKTAEVVEYGLDNLSAGPNIDKFDSVIFVEGRADVLNMLRNDISNVIAVGGASVPKTVVGLSQKKEVTVFTDGDRGGNIILTQLGQACEIDYVARAPTGKEVEELTRKELIKCLRTKVPFEQAIENLEAAKKMYNSKAWLYQNQEPQQVSKYGTRSQSSSRASSSRPSSSRQSSDTSRSTSQSSSRTSDTSRSAQQSSDNSRNDRTHRDNRRVSRPVERAKEPEKEEKVVEKEEIPKDPYLAALKEIENSLHARFYDKKFKMVKEVPIRNMLKVLEKEKSVETIIFDGIITQRLIDVSGSIGVNKIVGLRVGNVYKPSDKIELVVPE